jgi:hypothetical protein
MSLPNATSNDANCSTEYVNTGDALRRAAASGGGVVCAGFVNLSVPPKVGSGALTAIIPLSLAFRRKGDRLASPCRRVRKLPWDTCLGAEDTFVAAAGFTQVHHLPRSEKESPRCVPTLAD